MPRITLALTLTAIRRGKRAAVIGLIAGALGSFATQVGAEIAARGVSSSDATSHTKLVWKPYRPDSEEAKAKTLGYDEELSDRPARRKARAAAAQLGAPTEATADPFEDKRVQHPFAEEAPPAPTDDATPGDDTLPAPRESSPPLEMDSTPAQPDPIELNPPTPRVPSAPSPQLRMRARQPSSQPTRILQEPQAVPGEIELAPSRRTEADPEADCEEAYDKLKSHTLDKLSIDIKVAGEAGSDVPYECGLGDDQFEGRCWNPTTFTWKASALCHKPLYFEDYKLERYGHSHGPCCEYLASAAHFFGDLVLLPYHVGLETPCECVYALGHYRPGNCAPYMFDPFPFSCRAAATAAAGYCGVIALFP